MKIRGVLSFLLFIAAALLDIPKIPMMQTDSILSFGSTINEIKASYFGSDGASNTHADLSIWHKTLDDALKQAKSLNKNIFIDFTGWSCTNCRWIESNMFPQKAVKHRLDRLVKAKLYTDRRKEPEKTNKSIMQEKFGSIAIPLYVLMTPEGTVIDEIRFTRDEKAFTRFLDKALSIENTED